MKKLTQSLAVIATMCLATTAFAQVGIGTTNPNASAELDIVSANRGLLLPRVSLSNTTLSTPLAAHVAGMTVYNIAPAVNDVSPGLYYNDGAKWIRLNSNDWTVNGNAGTNVTNNFVGTTDNQALAIRTNNVERARFLTNGNVGINETVPQQKLHIGGTNPATETIRIEALNQTNHTDNNGQDLSPLAVDLNGDIVIGGPSFLSNTITDLDETNFLEPSVSVESVNGEQQWTAVMHTENFTLTQQTLVEINFAIPVGVSDPDTGGPITDGIARWYGVVVYVDGNFENWFNDLYSNFDDGVTLTGPGGETNLFTSGPFMLNGSVYVSLPLGAHSVEIYGTTSGARRYVTATPAVTTDHVDTEVEFGGNGAGASLKIIKHN